MGKKIYLCTTFREFNGNKNAKIQEKFLQTIKNQTYDNYELIITTFGEKTVAPFLKSFFSENKVKVIDMPKVGYRYSLTDVVINAIDNVAEPGILIWSTCDIEFDKNYFETLNGAFCSGLSGITHPNMFFNEENGTLTVGSLSAGIDVLFFDTEFLKRMDVYSDIKKYRFLDWGIFEQFLCGIAKKYTKVRINTFSVSKVTKHINDRTENNEGNTFFEESLKRNRPVFEKFLRERGLSFNFSWLLYCHMQFKNLRIDSKYLKSVIKDKRSYRSLLEMLRIYSFLSILKKYIKRD